MTTTTLIKTRSGLLPEHEPTGIWLSDDPVSFHNAAMYGDYYWWKELDILTGVEAGPDSVHTWRLHSSRWPNHQLPTEERKRAWQIRRALNLAGIKGLKIVGDVDKQPSGTIGGSVKVTNPVAFLLTVIAPTWSVDDCLAFRSCGIPAYERAAAERYLQLLTN